MKIKILGPGCVNCQKVEKLIREAVAEAGVAAVCGACDRFHGRSPDTGFSARRRWSWT